MNIYWFSFLHYAFTMILVRCFTITFGPFDVEGYWNRIHNIFMALVISPVALICVLITWHRQCVLVNKWPLDAYFSGVCDTYGTDYIMTQAFDILIITKYIEWIDTIILILRRRPLQLLHLWHHSTIVIVFQTGFCSGSWAVVGIMNSLIHIVMYAYYAKIGFLKRFASYITTCQIFHLTLGTILSVYTFSIASCTESDRDVNGLYLSLIHISEPTRPY